MTKPYGKLGDLVTIAMIPRDTFALSGQVLDRLIETTPTGVRIIVMDTGASQDARQYMEQRCRENGLTLMRSKDIATPNQTRNKAIELIDTKYVAFVDNDTLVTEGWLEPLINCAEETDAWVVGPVICERLPEATFLHGYDGELELRETSDGARFYHDLHYNAHVRLDDVRHKLERTETRVAELHAQLVAMEAFDKLGPYDDNIVNMYEYGEFQLRIHECGEKIMLEPGSIVTYVPPGEIPRADREFFEVRWCEAWTDLTETSLAAKYGLTPRHPDAKPVHNFVRRQRMLGKNWLRKPRKVFGNKAVRWLERKVLVPIDTAINRWKYPASRYGRITPVGFVRVS